MAKIISSILTILSLASQASTFVLDLIQEIVLEFIKKLILPFISHINFFLSWMITINIGPC